MSRVCKWLAILSAILSVTAFILALSAGTVLLALHGLLAAIGLLSGADERLPYPLGVWVYPLYLLGLALSLTALRHPRWAGLGMIPLGLCAALLGGPIAQIYGYYMMVAGAALAIVSVFGGLEDHHAGPARSGHRAADQ